MATRSANRVCVIGGGIAGLVTAKVLHHDGFDVTLFERNGTPGGVWAASRTYPGLRANNSYESYAFSDFPYPPGTDDFPTAEQIRAYLGAYAEHFGLDPLLHLSTEVVSVARTTTAGGTDAAFHISVRPTGTSGVGGSFGFDFVAVCNGVFCEPYVPEVCGRERFTGVVLHSSEFTDPAFVRDRRVIVVGAGKSAFDCAAFASSHAQSCTLVFRAPHWMMPRYLPSGRRIDEVLITRFSEMLLPLYHHPSRAAAVLHGSAAPLVRLWWRGQNRLVRRLLKMPPEMLPETPLPSGFENAGVGNDFYVALETGRIKPKRGRVTEFVGADAVALDTGERIEADTIILATGWRHGVPFLDADLRDCVVRNGAYHLYRHILPPNEHRLGCIGYSASVAAQLTSEIGAHWLSQCFRGELALPSDEEMDREIARVGRWMADRFPARPEGYFVGPYISHYLDELLTDMGLPTNRTGTRVREYMAPLWPSRYRGVAEERRRARGAPSELTMAAPYCGLSIDR